MDRRRIEGGTTSSLLLVLVLLVGVGAWNYHRNFQQERASERGRPYASYSVREVQLLREAAGSELAAAKARFEKARRGRAGSARDRGSLGDNARQFARTTRASEAIRAAAADVAEHESLAAALDQELAARSELGAGMDRHLKRLTTF
ncbi:MAG: hypothetical protein U0900_02325 [Myxococcota bacterium]